jgi:DNA-binding Lrp family transcriptional regulator
MDDLDFKIIKCLNEDGRKSLREVARGSEVSTGTAYNRIRRLEATGVIRGYAPIIDARAAGYDLTAAIGVRIAHGKLLEVERKVAKDPRVFAVYDLTGEWDALILARFRNREELNDFVKSTLSQEHVERTNTQLVLNTVKEESRFNPPCVTEK